MKRFYKTIILLLISAALLAYLAYYQKQHNNTKPEIFNIDVENINQVLILNQKRSELVHLINKNKSWYIYPFVKREIPENVPSDFFELIQMKNSMKTAYIANEAIIRIILNAFINLEPFKEIFAKKASYDQFGFNKNNIKVWIKSSKNKPMSITIGQNASIGSKIYILFSFYKNNIKVNKIYLVDEVFSRAINKSYLDIRARDLVFLSKQDINKITIKKRRKRILLKKSLLGWSILEPLIDTTQEIEINKLLLGLTTTNVKDFLKDSYTENDLSKFGLKNANFTYIISAKNLKKPMELFFKKNRNKYYVANSLNRFIAEIDKDLYDKLNVSLEVLRDKHLVHYEMWNVFKFEVIYKDIITKSILNDDTWVTTQSQKTAASKSRPVQLIVNKSHIETFLKNLKDERIKQFVYNGRSPRLNEYGMAKNPMKIQIWIKDKNKNEKLQDSIIIGREYKPSRRSRISNKKLKYIQLDDKPYIYGVSNKIIDTIPNQFLILHKEKNRKARKVLLGKKGRIKKLRAPFTIQNRKYVAMLSTKKGDVEIELFHKDTPYTVSNFINLARNGFYNNLKFHRATAGFIVQTGDPTGTGNGGPGYTFKDEISNRKHLRGTLSMAKTTKPHTNGSQFFICLSPQPHLDGINSVFGRVTKGMDIVDSINENDIVEEIKVYEIQD